MRLRVLVVVAAAFSVGVPPSVALGRTRSAAVAAPTRVVRVPWGQIGYRSIGHGSPLVLVTGSPDSIDLWAPKFVDLLAQHHRVLAFDNEGVGRTTLRRGKLTISRMGDDTASFIAALHLKRPDVLGWSMGGMIVQALAVRHPSALRRMILCATSAGDGSAIAPLAVSHQPYDLLFPADQNAVRLAFIRDVNRYRGFYLAPSSTRPLQAIAIIGWAQGQEPAGHHLQAVRAPTLIADGSDDPLNPTTNSYALKAKIPHAHLDIYRDASHGFWFQDRADWVQRIDRFLS